MNAKQKRILKLTLDAAMLVLLVLMYKKQIISIGFHEIGGLALIGLFIIHLLFNAKWIGVVTVRLFAKTTSARVRICYIVDALLLAAFLTVGVSGMLISKVVFSINAKGNFETLHYFTSALSIILMGVHLGLHTNYIFGKLLRKHTKKTGKIILAIIMTLAIVFGIYSMFASSFVSYVTAPVQTSRFPHSVSSPTGEAKLDGSDVHQWPTDLSELPDANADAGTIELPQRNDAFSGNRWSGQSEGSFGGNGGRYGAGSVLSVLMLIAQYISIIVVFAAITYLLFRLITRHTSSSKPDPLCGDDPMPDEPDEPVVME